MQKLDKFTNMGLSKKDAKRIEAEQEEINKLFLAVFDNDEGERVLEMLDAQAHRGFPNYDNDRITYSLIGKQKMVEEIKRFAGTLAKAVHRA